MPLRKMEEGENLSDAITRIEGAGEQIISVLADNSILTAPKAARATKATKATGPKETR